MANVRSGNCHYVDSTGTLDSAAVRVAAVVLTATGASAVLELTAADGTTKQLNLRVATSGETKHFDFSTKVLSFPAGLRVTTLTNAIATIVYN